MVSRKQIITTLDQAEEEFVQCWAILVELKRSEVDAGFATRFFDFQSILADSLYRLNRVYAEIADEKRTHIRNKGRLQEEWFASRMRKLAKYQSAIKEAISIGKSLGNSFAWLFYADSRDFLLEHHRHSNNFFMSTGFGGKAEVEFIRNVRFISGYLVIYHANTSFLRLGDISLYDLSSRRIVAIGEMKSKKVKDGAAQITVLFSGPEFNDMMDKADKIGKVNTQILKIELEPQAQDRLVRQLKRMDRAFANLKPADKLMAQTSDDLRVQELEKLGRKLKVGIIQTQKVGDGLMLIGIKQRRSKLSSRILPSKTRIFQDKFAPIPNALQAILDPSSQSNSLFYGAFHYGADSGPYLLAGMTPLYYWNIDAELIRRILFGEALIFSAYNPVHLIRKLRQAGFVVEIDKSDGRKIKVAMYIDDRVLEIKGFGHFLAMIQHYLFSEEDIVKLLKTFTTEAHKDAPVNSIIEMYVIQRL